MKTKEPSFFYKLLYFINSIFAFLLLLSFIIPFIKPDTLGSFSAFSLVTPVLILINLFFLMYWIFKLSATFFLSFIVIALGFFNVPRFYKISGRKILLTDDVKMMSYNVRMFNRYHWIKQDSIQEDINALIAYKAPDIVCLQEYAPNKELEATYPYSHIKYSSNNSVFGHAILSKFPIINRGSIDFKKTANTILFADLVIDSDTFRVYNVHLQSLKINPEKEHFGQKDSEKLRKRISSAFKTQQYQVQAFLKHQNKTQHKVLLAGDFNNTAYSWSYRALCDGKNDAFVEAGKGFGRSFDFIFPMRIDFIMADKSIRVNAFKTYHDKFSDHFPIMARFERESLLKEE